MDSEEGRVKRRNRRTALQILFASKPQDQVDGRLRSREDMDVQYDTNIQSINSNSVPEWVHMPVQPSRNRTRGRIKQRKTQVRTLFYRAIIYIHIIYIFLYIVSTKTPKNYETITYYTK